MTECLVAKRDGRQCFMEKGHTDEHDFLYMFPIKVSGPCPIEGCDFESVHENHSHKQASNLVSNEVDAHLAANHPEWDTQ